MLKELFRRLAALFCSLAYMLAWSEGRFEATPLLVLAVSLLLLVFSLSLSHLDWVRKGMSFLVFAACLMGLVFLYLTDGLLSLKEGFRLVMNNTDAGKRTPVV